MVVFSLQECWYLACRKAFRKPLQKGLLPHSLWKGQSQLVKGRPIHSNNCGKYSLCQLDHAQQRKSDITLYFRHKFIF